MSSIISCDVVHDIGRIAPRFQVIQFVTIGTSVGVLRVERKFIAERNHNGSGRSPTRNPCIITK